jgi:hypothetical protein
MSIGRRAYMAGARGANRSRARARGRLLGPTAGFWGSVLPPLLDTLADNRARRVRAGVRFQRARLDRRVAGLRAIERELAEGEMAEEGGAATPVEDPYGTTVDGESQVPVPAESAPPAPAAEPAPAPAPAPAPTPAPTAVPSTRTLYKIFDRLDPESELTEDNYPKVSVVNAALEDEGEPRSDRDTIGPVYDRWLHDRWEEGELTRPMPVAAASVAEPKPLTDEVLFAAFDDLDSNDFTADEPKYPKVDMVAERIPPGYEKPTRAIVRAAYDRYPRKRDD